MTDQVDDDLDPVGVPAELDEHGAGAWRKIVPALERVGRVKATDIAMITRYCDLVGRYWLAKMQIQEAGGEYQRVPTVAKDESGATAYMVRRHPACLTMEKLLPELRQIEDRFGMSPLSRANLLAKGLRAGAQGDLLPGETPTDRDAPADPGAWN